MFLNNVRTRKYQSIHIQQIVCLLPSYICILAFLCLLAVFLYAGLRCLPQWSLNPSKNKLLQFTCFLKSTYPTPTLLDYLHN